MSGLDTSMISPKLSDVDIIQQWNIDNKKITAGKYQDQSYYFITQNGQDTLVARENITGIPLGLDLKILSAFLTNTWVRISLLSDGQSKLSIQPKLCGGANINFDPARFWPNGAIPYEIDTKTFPVGEIGRPIILAAIDEWNKAGTGFHFVPRTHEKDVLVFGENDQGTCYSEVGRKGGVQYIRCHLEGQMFNKGSIMHEIGHAIGFNHEHQRYDRDNYLDLANKKLSNNVNYRKSDAGNRYGSYDFGSIMHYPVNVPLTDGQQMNVRPGVFLPNTDLSTIGNSQTLSHGDIDAAKALYQKTIKHDETREEQGLAPMPSVAFSSPNMEELSRVPEWETLQKQGKAYFDQKNYGEALKYYGALLKEYNELFKPSFVAQLHDLCGLCCYHLGGFTYAAQWFANAHQLAPTEKKYATHYQAAQQALQKSEGCTIL